MDWDGKLFAEVITTCKAKWKNVALTLDNWPDLCGCVVETSIDIVSNSNNQTMPLSYEDEDTQMNMIRLIWHVIVVLVQDLASGNQSAAGTALVESKTNNGNPAFNTNNNNNSVNNEQSSHTFESFFQQTFVEPQTGIALVRMMLRRELYGAWWQCPEKVGLVSGVSDANNSLENSFNVFNSSNHPSLYWISKRIQKFKHPRQSGIVFQEGFEFVKKSRMTVMHFANITEHVVNTCIDKCKAQVIQFESNEQEREVAEEVVEAIIEVLIVVQCPPLSAFELTLIMSTIKGLLNVLFKTHMLSDITNNNNNNTLTNNASTSCCQSCCIMQ